MSTLSFYTGFCAGSPFLRYRQLDMCGTLCMIRGTDLKKCLKSLQRSFTLAKLYIKNKMMPKVISKHICYYKISFVSSFISSYFPTVFLRNCSYCKFNCFEISKPILPKIWHFGYYYICLMLTHLYIHECNFIFTVQWRRNGPWTSLC